MNIKRIMTALIGLPIVFLGLVFGNKYIVDFAMAIVAIMAFYEYDHCVKKEYKVKNNSPVKNKINVLVNKTRKAIFALNLNV